MMETQCAHLKTLAAGLEAAASASTSINNLRGPLAEGSLALMELKSVNRTVCLNTEQVPHGIFCCDTGLTLS